MSALFRLLAQDTRRFGAVYVGIAIAAHNAFALSIGQEFREC
jgi:hypothetical protein